MRSLAIRLLLLVMVTLVGGSTSVRGQFDGTYDVPGLPQANVPIPTGQAGHQGVYTFGEFIILTQTWTLGDQTVAFRGLVDSSGDITGTPGTYIGSGKVALSTKDFGRVSYNPGYRIGAGYALGNGISVEASFLQQMDRNYHAGATLASPFFRSARDLSDTYLVAGVFNFPPQFAGPLTQTTFDDVDGIIPVVRQSFGPQLDVLSLGNQNPFQGGNTYGIWNAAAVMDIQYNQRFTEGQIQVRVPMFQTEYSRIYGLAGGRFDWFFERFQWRTVAYDILGRSSPRTAADYTNTLSQRMYGPFVGCGHEVYLGNRFAVSLDVTGAALLDLVKERAKYELRSEEIQNKHSRDTFNIVPSFTANLNLWWYPLEGVQMRVGYNAWTFFNTRRMENPIDFNYGQIDPVYETQYFRLVHGVNVGLGLFF